MKVRVRCSVLGGDNIASEGGGDVIETSSSRDMASCGALSSGMPAYGVGPAEEESAADTGAPSASRAACEEPDDGESGVRSADMLERKGQV